MDGVIKTCIHENGHGTINYSWYFYVSYNNDNNIGHLYCAATMIIYSCALQYTTENMHNSYYIALISRFFFLPGLKLIYCSRFSCKKRVIIPQFGSSIHECPITKGNFWISWRVFQQRFDLENFEGGSMMFEMMISSLKVHEYKLVLYYTMNCFLWWFFFNT